uniref:Uncharacterized protein n=1 Tax=Anguilla anguilla TaxID=7936 RepID=A0A0E9QXZ8_ANGAN
MLSSSLLMLSAEKIFLLQIILNGGYYH